MLAFPQERTQHTFVHTKIQIWLKICNFKAQQIKVTREDSSPLQRYNLGSL